MQRGGGSRRLRTLGWSALFLALALTAPLGAEVRFYESAKPRGSTMEAFVDELTRSGIRFTIRKVFNEDKDGRVGFIFHVAPKRLHCEVTFHERPRGSLVRLMTQNTDEAIRFERLLTQNLKLKALGDDPSRFGDTRGFLPRR